MSLMEIQTILLADPAEEVILELARALRPEFRVLCCGSGPEALEILNREHPALLIMELSLPRMDGMALLRELRSLDPRPLVLIHTAANTNYLIGALGELPVDYLLRKPTPISTIVERAREMLAFQADTPVQWQVSDLLIRLGIPEHMQGFRNMAVGIPLLIDDPGQFLGKTLYRQIASQNRVTCDSVEKSIRDAIRAGWDRGNRALWLQYFPGAADMPQNKPFLIRMAGILGRFRRCG
jgi:CheY-like chemotaxis protein